MKKAERVLLYGNSSESKIEAVNQIAEQNNQDIHKIPLSKLMFQSIEEIEENLTQLFAEAESKGWILFFDEADALFAKRTNVKDAHDKYASGETAYLLQKIKSFNGIIIFDCKECDENDEAATDYFHSIIHFPGKDKL